MTGCPTPILLTDTQLNTCLTHCSGGAQGLNFSALQSVNAREVGQHQLVHLFHQPLQTAQRIGENRVTLGRLISYEDRAQPLVASCHLPPYI